jgi:chemotaxis signal transduction protein
VSQFVTFRLDGQRYATRIDELREVVRLADLAVLPGMRPPVVGVLDLRGTSLPVVDVRRNPSPDRGDVLVVGATDQEFGLACDPGTDVASADEFTPEASPAGGDAGRTLPPYVEAVLRGPAGAVFVVDVRRMAVEYADSLDVALEDGALREPGEALADALRSSLPDAVDGL